MTLGLFDLPAPLLQWIDNGLTAFIPVPVTVGIWAAAGAILSMELYRVLSPQQRIGRIKQEASAAQGQLSDYDGELEGAWPLIKNMLGLSLRRVGIVIPATLAAAYPVLALLAWLSNSYGHQFPEQGEEAVVEIAEPFQARWIGPDDDALPRIQALRPDGQVALDIPVTAPVPVIHKRVWWNRLIENPAGYLPDDAPFDEIRTGVPGRELFVAGPTWLRGWEAVFLPVLFLVAIGYKSARRID
jgi:hypothetical protein